MKKLLILLIINLLPIYCFSDIITVRQLKVPRTLKQYWDGSKVAKNHTIEQNVLSPKYLYSNKGKTLELFIVEEAANPELIGKKVTCNIAEYRRSNIKGEEAFCIILPLYIKTENSQIELEHVPIILRGKNRSNIKFWLGWVPPMLFIPGTGVRIDYSTHFYMFLK